ncbi:Nicotinamide N-methyltransferase, partial [Stegodyphus mimosarum]
MTARKELESRIRKSVKCVVRSDLLSDTVLPLEPLIATETEPPFDLVISVLCIETAAPDYEGYIDILKRINSLLKVGGGLIICGYENGSMWQVGDKTFHHIKLTTKQLLEALGTAGFGKCDLRTCPKRESEYSYDYETLFCVAAEKL